MKNFILKISMAGAMVLVVSPVYAKCMAPATTDDMTPDQVSKVYDCIKGSLREGYKKNENEWAKTYSNWGAANSVPGPDAGHSNRFLFTFVNDIGYKEYIKFSEERADNPMPTGTVIAKESFKVKDNLEVRKGPLFFMEKVAKGQADDTNNWVYSVISPNGKTAKIKQDFCHGCHGSFEDQDSLGYPGEEARIGAAQ